MKTNKTNPNKRNSPLCKGCSKFDAYDSKDGKNGDNCAVWLCNKGGCSKDKLVLQESNKFFDKHMATIKEKIHEHK